MLGRFKHWTHLNLIILTQGFFNVFCAGLVWVVTGRFTPPSPDECFSTRVGRSAIRGERLGLLLQRVVDGLLGKGHCERSARDND